MEKQTKLLRISKVLNCIIYSSPCWLFVIMLVTLIIHAQCYDTPQYETILPIMQKILIAAAWLPLVLLVVNAFIVLADSIIQNRKNR